MLSCDLSALFLLPPQFLPCCYLALPYSPLLGMVLVLPVCGILTVYCGSQPCYHFLQVSFLTPHVQVNSTIYIYLPGLFCRLHENVHKVHALCSSLRQSCRSPHSLGFHCRRNKSTSAKQWIKPEIDFNVCESKIG